MLVVAASFGLAEILLHVRRFVFRTAVTTASATPTSAATAYCCVEPEAAQHGILSCRAWRRFGVRLGNDAFRRGHWYSRCRTTRLKEVEKFVEWREIATGSVRIAELDRHAKSLRRGMRQRHDGEQSPGIAILAARCPVVAIGGQQVDETALRHGCPIERQR